MSKLRAKKKRIISLSQYKFDFFHKLGATPNYTKKKIFKLPGNRVMWNLKKKMNIIAFKTYLAGFLVAAYGKDHYLILF